jgi:hypothetical protein
MPPKRGIQVRFLSAGPQSVRFALSNSHIFYFSNELKSQSDYLLKKLSTAIVDKLQKVLLSVEFL